MTSPATISALSKQLTGFVADNRAQLRPALDKLNGVLTIVDNRKERMQKSIKLLNSYAMSLGESVSSGPFFKAYVPNLLPGQFVQPFVDAAFSDLGLDPNVLLPSQRTDPQTGQPGTPPLPVPYPRTGQGGAAESESAGRDHRQCRAIRATRTASRCRRRRRAAHPRAPARCPGRRADTHTDQRRPSDVPDGAGPVTARQGAGVVLAIALVLVLLGGGAALARSRSRIDKISVVAYFDNSNGDLSPATTCASSA